MLWNKQLVLTDFHSMEQNTIEVNGDQTSLVTSILQNNLFCAQQKEKKTHTGLEQLEGKWWQNVHFWVNYLFKAHFKVKGFHTHIHSVLVASVLSDVSAAESELIWVMLQREQTANHGSPSLSDQPTQLIIIIHRAALQALDRKPFKRNSHLQEIWSTSGSRYLKRKIAV